MALVFAVVLAVLGVRSPRKRPWKGGKDRMAVMKAFTVFSLQFVMAEGVTGMTSIATGRLSMPPIAGIGAEVDLVILISGPAEVYVEFHRKAPNRD